MATKRKKEPQGLDKYTWIRRSRRTYRNNKPKFFLYVFGFFLLLFLIYMTYKRIEYNQMINTYYSGQQIQQGQQSAQAKQNSQNSGGQNYTSIYDYKAPPLVLRQPQTPPQQSAENKKLNQEAPQPPVRIIQPIAQKLDKIYPIEPPTMENFSLGQNITEADLARQQFKINVKMSPQSFMAQKEGARYKLFNQDGALFFIEVKNNKLVKMSFSFENVDTRALTQKVLQIYGVEPENTFCIPTKVLNEEKLKTQQVQEFIETDICQTQAKGSAYTLQVVSLVKLNKTMVAFELK